MEQQASKGFIVVVIIIICTFLILFLSVCLLSWGLILIIKLATVLLLGRIIVRWFNMFCAFSHKTGMSKLSMSLILTSDFMDMFSCASFLG